MLEAFEGTDRNTNPCESYFGSLKYYDQLFHCGVHNTNAVIATHRNGIFGSNARKYMIKGTQRKEHASSSMEKKRKRDAADESVGELDLLGVDLSMVVMDLSRRKGAQRVRDEARAHKDAADQASLARDEKRKEVMLENQIKCYCKAQDALDVAPLVDDATLGGRASLAQLTARVDAALASKATPGAHTLLKAQIQRYVLGMGFRELAPKYYSSEVVDSTIGAAGSDVNIAFLRETLINIYAEVKAKRVTLVTEPAVPELHRRVLPTFGGRTMQRARIES